MIGIAGVIPAAGSSRRMGRPKALLELEGRPFVHHAVRALVEGGCVPVLVVVADDGTGGGSGTRVAEAARAAGARVVVNPDPGEGPITSIRRALGALAADGAPPGPPVPTGARGAAAPPRYLALLPVDHPAVARDTVAALVRAAEASGAPLVLPVHRGERGHPALIGRALFPELEDPSLRGGARAVVHRHLEEAALVETADPGVLTDVDTPEAYAALVEARPGGAAARTERGADGAATRADGAA